jgi:hypothetical protein
MLTPLAFTVWNKWKAKGMPRFSRQERHLSHCKTVVFYFPVSRPSFMRPFITAAWQAIFSYLAGHCKTPACFLALQGSAGKLSDKLLQFRTPRAMKSCGAAVSVVHGGRGLLTARPGALRLKGGLDRYVFYHEHWS